MSPLPPLHDRVAIVTGANHGIGAATACRLAALGAAVLVTYRRHTNAASGDVPAAYARQRAQDASAVVDNITAAGGRAVAVEADLADPATAGALFDRAEADLGPVSILVNNASGWVADTFAAAPLDGLGRHLAAVSPATIDQVLAVDTRAAALLMAELAGRLRARGERWGRIVGLTSGGPHGFPSEVSYGAAKAAQESYTLSAATELAPLGVTANVVHPPVTDTGWITPAVRDLVATSPDHTHIVEPAEVADVIGWLCTAAAYLVTGNVIRLR